MQHLSDALALFISSFWIAFSGALMPGPLLRVTIAEAQGKGTRAGPLVVTGHAIAELALITAAVIGLQSLLLRHPVKGTIYVVGALVLLWMGLAMTRGSAQAARQAVSALDQSQNAPLQPSSTMRSIALGAAASVLNPYWTFWWLTIGLNLMTRGLQIGKIGITSFYIGHILADLVWYWLVAFAITHGTRWLGFRGYRMLLLICAAALLLLGLWSGRDGISLLFLSHSS